MRWALSLGALCLALLGAHRAIDRLGHARAAEAALMRARAPVRWSLAPGLTGITAHDRRSAEAVLERRVADAASTTGVRLGSGPAATPADDFVAVTIAASGPERAVRAFAAGIEGQPPLARLIVERMRSDAGGVTLKAQVIAPWRPA